MVFSLLLFSSSIYWIVWDTFWSRILKSIELETPLFWKDMFTACLQAQNNDFAAVFNLEDYRGSRCRTLDLCFSIYFSLPFRSAILICFPFLFLGILNFLASREKCYKQIEAAIAKYREIKENVNEGLKFYVTLQVWNFLFIPPPYRATNSFNIFRVPLLTVHKVGDNCTLIHILLRNFRTPIDTLLFDRTIVLINFIPLHFRTGCNHECKAAVQRFYYDQKYTMPRDDWRCTETSSGSQFSR